MDLEPVGPSAIATPGLGHTDRQALLESAGLARGAVPLVDDAEIVVLAVWDHCLVVAESPEEGLAALAGEGPEVEAGGLLITDPAQLVLQRVDVVDLVLGEHVVGGQLQARVGDHLEDDRSLEEAPRGEADSGV